MVKPRNVEVHDMKDIFIGLRCASVKRVGEFAQDGRRRSTWSCSSYLGREKNAQRHEIPNIMKIR